MPNTCRPYPASMLPQGFCYPEHYLRLVQGAGVPNGLIWDFPDDQYNFAEKEWEFRLCWGFEGWLYLDEIDPIPFARSGDWAAFFDGNDHSGDPKVIVVDLGNKRNSYKLLNFDTWFDRALMESGLK